MILVLVVALSAALSNQTVCKGRVRVKTGDSFSGFWVAQRFSAAIREDARNSPLRRSIEKLSMAQRDIFARKKLITLPKYFLKNVPNTPPNMI
jgi:hypothetical protein